MVMAGDSGLIANIGKRATDRALSWQPSVCQCWQYGLPRL